MTRDHSRERQLILLGACLAQPQLLESVAPSDFRDSDIAAVVQEVQDGHGGDDTARKAIRLRQLFDDVGVSIGVGVKALQALAGHVKVEAKADRVRRQVGHLRFGPGANGLTPEAWLDQFRAVMREIDE